MTIVTITLLLIVCLLVPGFSAKAQVNINAQYRNRFELRDGYQRLKEEGATPAAFISQRTRLAISYETEGLKLRFTPQDVRVWGDEQLSSSTGVFGDYASLDLFEAYVEIKTGQSSWLSVGRQQLVYDNQRILAARNWNQNGLSYDAVILKLNPGEWQLHVGSSWNSTGENLSDNFYPPSRIKSLSYMWVNRQVADNWNLSVSHVASGVTQREDSNILKFRQTTGLYAVLKESNLSAFGNIYYQFGRNQQGAKVSALLVDAEANYKIDDFAPGIGISYLSGNSKAGSEQVTDHLFDILYGARHRFFGFMDYFRSFGSHTRQGGLVDYYFYLDYKISKSTSIRNTGHYFTLATINALTPEEKQLGYENDLVLKHQFSKWGALEAGYLFMLPESTLKAIQNTPNTNFSQFLYLQLTINPQLK